MNFRSDFGNQSRLFDNAIRLPFSLCTTPSDPHKPGLIYIDVVGYITSVMVET